jgi:5-amino-6-(5-phosphoribosylamino)uracil reductase
MGDMAQRDQLGVVFGVLGYFGVAASTDVRVTGPGSLGLLSFAGVHVRLKGRFETYAAHKTAVASRASLAAWVTDLDAHTNGQLAIGSDWSRELFDGPLYVSPAAAADLPSTSLVFVQSRDGNTVAPNPASLGGGATDQHLVYEGLSRVAADAVLAGAGTIRGGDIVFSVWRPELVEMRRSLGRPRHPIQVVATLKGLNIREAMLFNIPELPVVLLTAHEWVDTVRGAIAERPWIDTVVMEKPEDLRQALTELRAMGVRTLSCVGGPTLARQLIDAGLVQDLYLTTSARDGGQANTPLYSKPLTGRLVVRKRGTGADAGVVFEHARLD